MYFVRTTLPNLLCACCNSCSISCVIPPPAHSTGDSLPRRSTTACPAAQRHTIDETCVDPVIHAKENALAAQALLDAYRMTENAAYRDHAATVLDHLWRSMWHATHGMARNWNGTAYGWGWLPDQTAAARAFVHAYETTGERKYLDRAQAVCRAHPVGSITIPRPAASGIARLTA